jgi:hypothetical protein
MTPQIAQIAASMRKRAKTLSFPIISSHSATCWNILQKSPSYAFGCIVAPFDMLHRLPYMLFGWLGTTTDGPVMRVKKGQEVSDPCRYHRSPDALFRMACNEAVAELPDAERFELGLFPGNIHVHVGLQNGGKTASRSGATEPGFAGNLKPRSAELPRIVEKGAIGHAPQRLSRESRKRAVVFGDAGAPGRVDTTPRAS